MKKMLSPLLLFSIMFSCFNNKHASGGKPNYSDTAFEKATGKWFAAWELVSHDVFNIDTLQPVEFLFFDDKYVYSTSVISIPNGQLITGPALLNQSFTWKKALYYDSIMLPDKQMVAAGLMSFASELHKEKAVAYFVMPLPVFWEKSGVTSKELGLENLITGVFLHEFSHSQQMQNFGQELTKFEKSNSFETEFNDDIVQNIFKDDSAYTALFRNELKIFYEATTTDDGAAKKTLVKNGMGILKKRHTDFFTGKHEKLKEADTFFLTMEGLGQFAMYAWLTHPNGANIDVASAITGVRRGGKWWSQDEGLALFLILAQNNPPKNWGPLLFGTQTVDVTALISNSYY